MQIEENVQLIRTRRLLPINLIHLQLQSTWPSFSLTRNISVSCLNYLYCNFFFNIFVDNYALLSITNEVLMLLVYLSTWNIHVNLPVGAFFSRFWGSLPSLLSTLKIFRPWKKSSTIKSWPTFCDQYFWKFPVWNSRADEKRQEIRMVKVNVIFNDIRLLICLTPLQVNWVMVIN